VHGHVKDFLAALSKNPNAQLVAIVEPNATLAEQYASQSNITYRNLFDTGLEHMLTPNIPTQSSSTPPSRTTAES